MVWLLKPSASGSHSSGFQHMSTHPSIFCVQVRSKIAISCNFDLCSFPYHRQCSQHLVRKVTSTWLRKPDAGRCHSTDFYVVQLRVRSLLVVSLFLFWTPSWELSIFPINNAVLSQISKDWSFGSAIQVCMSERPCCGRRPVFRTAGTPGPVVGFMLIA